MLDFIPEMLPTHLFSHRVLLDKVQGHLWTHSSLISQEGPLTMLLQFSVISSPIIQWLAWSVGLSNTSQPVKVSSTFSTREVVTSADDSDIAFGVATTRTVAIGARRTSTCMLGPQWENTYILTHPAAGKWTSHLFVLKIVCLLLANLLILLSSFLNMLSEPLRCVDYTAGWTTFALLGETNKQSTELDWKYAAMINNGMHFGSSGFVSSCSVWQGNKL